MNTEITASSKSSEIKIMDEILDLNMEQNNRLAEIDNLLLRLCQRIGCVDLKKEIVSTDINKEEIPDTVIDKFKRDGVVLENIITGISDKIKLLELVV